MANAGYSNDKKLIRSRMDSGKLIKLYPDDDKLQIIFKNYINNLISNDVITNEFYCGKNYLVHSSWKYVCKTLIKINQLRIKNWYFKEIKL